ncbi:MBL fold metallo-hydrolase [Amycolatopsis australiensis]|uniref:L-ascorbate metabolism protein UlaG, beta-lactamase superfamily n=1 Tax=Amycolatopsis australiensis TaxID=546364 RepID=A0A1K1RF94_9PSEU|nr:MBL fold metallo-hydrolase [Amycolatopsis australiensis]SFW70922.1 L-ascorbate metabolism protein UlaG, beta-lactamase superfamily [Amycolatopsis australiensis]
MTAPLTVTRIGHACQLIELGELRVLTDPWFTQTATYYPGEPVAARAGELGRIDALVVSHEHYDHCDLDALVTAGFDLDTPLVGPGTVTAIARDKGFRDVRTVEAWQATTVGDLTVTATPGQHGVHEVTFVIQAAGRTVFFGGDSLRVPELDTIPERFGHVDLAILPTNGLCVRPMNLRQVVMNAAEAAGLTAALRPTLAVPHHYAFHSGRLGDRMITKADRDPRHYADAVARLAPDVEVRMVLPGTPVTVGRAAADSCGSSCLDAAREVRRLPVLPTSRSMRSAETAAR